MAWFRHRRTWLWWCSWWRLHLDGGLFLRGMRLRRLLPGLCRNAVCRVGLSLPASSPGLLGLPGSLGLGFTYSDWAEVGGCRVTRLSAVCAAPGYRLTSLKQSYTLRGIVPGSTHPASNRCFASGGQVVSLAACANWWQARGLAGLGGSGGLPGVCTAMRSAGVSSNTQHGRDPGLDLGPRGRRDPRSIHGSEELNQAI